MITPQYRAGLNSVSKAAGQGSTDFQDNPSNRVADLDPEDIERIEVLKGASTCCHLWSKGCSWRGNRNNQKRKVRQAKS
jgi:hypothetical protein